MKIDNDNIIKTFNIRFIVLFIVVLISSAYYISHSKTKEFYTNFTNKIVSDIETKIKNKKDAQIYESIKQNGFVFFRVVIDKDQKEYRYYSNGKKSYVDVLQAQNKLKKDDKYKDYHYFIKMPHKEYYMAFYHPFYIDNIYAGYIDGLKKVPQQVIDDLQREIYDIVLIVIIILILFFAATYPLIYFSHKKLKEYTLIEIQHNLSTIRTLGNAIALRDSDTNEHNFRVSLYALEFAQHIKLDDENIRHLVIGAFLHDIGKIGIPDNVLLKNAKLTDDEFEIMKQHVNKGVELLDGNEWLIQGIDVVKFHHEKWDGTGYPNAIKGSNIPIVARMFAIVDVFDALTSKRPYKEPYDYEKSMDILNDLSGKHFDPKLLKSFAQISHRLYTEIRNEDIDLLRKRLRDGVESYFI